MACEIAYKESEIRTNNMQFASLIDFVIEIGREAAQGTGEAGFVERMMELRETTFWPGRGIQIEEDFPNLDEQKFWAKIFMDTARAIFDRRIGVHEHAFWQAQRIYQAYGVGHLFIQAVRDSKPNWRPNTIDDREFDEVINGRQQT